MDLSGTSIESSINDESFGSIISGIFGSTENLNSSNFDINNTIIEDVLFLWLHYKLPIKAFNELIKILKKIPNIAEDFRDSLNVNFEQCVAHALKSQEVVLYKKCASCFGYQGISMQENQRKQICERCQLKLDNSSYFVYIGLKLQLITMLNNYSDEILKYSGEVKKRHQENPNILNDIWDGDILKQLLEHSKDDILNSFCMNTDGASIHKSKNTSIWPIQLYINNLRPEIRYKNDNILVVALYVGTSAPDMDALFYPFLTELINMEQNKVKISCNGNKYVFTPMVTHCIVDLQAKRKLQGIQQYNSDCACTYCLQKGKSVKNKNRGFYVRYLYNQIPSKIRNHKDTVRTMLEVRENGTVDGVEKMSCLARLNNFDIIHSFSIDYMHQTLLGVTRTIMFCWFGQQNSKEAFYINKQKQNIINARLGKIKSFRSSSNPRSISELKKFKAKEFRDFLLFYITPCLEGILPKKYMEHFQLLSSAIYMLLKKTINRDDLPIAEKKMITFVRQFESLYGQSRVTMNLHLILHIPLMVEKSGPLWCQSAFFFESNNGELVKCIKGPTDILPQITKKYILKQTFKKHSNNEKYDIFLCEPLYDGREPEIETLKRELHLPPFTRFYKKLKVGKSIYTSTYYLRAKKTCNYFVCLNNGSMGIVKFYMEQNGKFFALIQKYSTTKSIDHIHEVQVESEQLICDIHDIKFKYTFIDIGKGKKYAVKPPNLIEIF